MAVRSQLQGMLGVYLTAAELTKQGFIVSVTARNAAGSDLLVTDQECKKAWSVQVKTNAGLGRFWDAGKRAKELDSATYVYVFIYLYDNRPPDYYVVPSHTVAECVRKRQTNAFLRSDAEAYKNGWQFFGSNSDAACRPAQVTIREENDVPSSGHVRSGGNGIARPDESGVPGVDVFRNDDAGYRRWLVDNPNGFLLSTRLAPNAPVHFHAVSCPYHKRNAGSHAANPFTTRYIKACCQSLPALRAWAKEQKPDGSEDICRCCRITPENALITSDHSTLDRDAGVVTAIEAAGGTNELARLLGIKSPSICGWSRVPAARVLEIERVTNGRAKRHVLRPDIFPDPKTGDPVSRDEGVN